MNDMYQNTSSDTDRVEVLVLYVEGDGHTATAMLSNPQGEPIRVPAAGLSNQTGLSYDALPGKRLVVTVRDGSPESFTVVGN